MMMFKMVMVRSSMMVIVMNMVMMFVMMVNLSI